MYMPSSLWFQLHSRTNSSCGTFVTFDFSGEEEKPMPDSLIWISGASRGIGAALLRHLPYPDARVINLDIQDAPGCENLRFDLTLPETWKSVAEHFAAELSAFRGRRAIFLQNAVVQGSSGLIGKVDPAVYQAALIGNFAAPIMLAQSFLRASRPGYELGLALMSSGASRGPVGQSAYGAAKAGLEIWVKVAREEFKDRPDTWIVAVRPGTVLTESALAISHLSLDLYPRADILKERYRQIGVDPDLGGRRIWSALPPSPDRPVISFDDRTDATPSL
jgi:NAD(P)-dependent dehydrogenase (short-subunit alcohol dehydrogenase family)